jgi:hypothetical protein
MFVIPAVIRALTDCRFPDTIISGGAPTKSSGAPKPPIVKAPIVKAPIVKAPAKAAPSPPAQSPSPDSGLPETDVPVDVADPAQDGAAPEDTPVEATSIVDEPTSVQDTDAPVETGEDTSIVDEPTSVQEGDAPAETGVQATSTVDEPTSVQETDVPVETGVEDTSIVDEPTSIDGTDTAVETGVDDVPTPTGTADTAAPTESQPPATGKGKGKDHKFSLGKFLGFLEGLLSGKSKSQQSTTPAEPPALSKRWMKERY